ncbi:MAG: M48 family metalloprotease [Acidobacteriia bacterium]|nr:M48 family metalloprotease [Terriglobia bacterium]
MARLERVRRGRWLAVCLAFCLVAGQGLAVRTAPELPDPGNPPMSRDQQKQLGLQAAGEVYKQMPVLPDSSRETQYIQKLGKRLAATIPPERSWPFQFHVIAQKEINAFALPGGPMFINIGTIQAADNEAELAGVMAHEMAHVYMQHSAKQQEKASLLGGLAGIVGGIAGRMGGVWGTLAQSGIQFGAGTLILKYSRSDEAQADEVGAIILSKASYNPVALADFFEKIEKQGSSGPQFLSDHPNPGNRRAAIEREIAEWPVRKYGHESPEFAAVRKDAASVRAYTAQEIADGAKSGRWAAENPKNGAVFSEATSGGSATVGTASQTNVGSVPTVPVTDVQPSSIFQQTDLSTMKIVRPENWDVMQGQQQGSVTIAPRPGVSGSAVAYGVVIQVVQPPSANMSVQQITAAIVRSLESSDSRMKQSGEIQAITVNGVAGGSVELQTVSPLADEEGKAQPERDWLVAVPRGDGNAIMIVFVATQRYFEQMRPTFEKMLRSVQF